MSKWKAEDFIPPLSKDGRFVDETNFDRMLDSLNPFSDKWDISACIDQIDTKDDIKKLLNWLAIDGRFDKKD